MRLSSLHLVAATVLSNYAGLVTAVAVTGISERSVASLTTCLQAISGLTVVTSSSSAYASDSAAYNRRITVHPAAIVYVYAFKISPKP